VWASHPLPPLSGSSVNHEYYYNGVMSKSSVITVRETPVAKTTSASAGGFAVVAETIDVDTAGRIELVDLKQPAIGG